VSGLSDNGWLMLSTGHRLDVAWSPLERVRRRLAELELGFVVAGCLGGVVSPEQEPLGQNMFVFRRGGSGGLPEDCVEQARHDWTGFLEHAGDPDVPDREKTVAWYRARRC